jgi:hypothetical protein
LKLEKLISANGKILTAPSLVIRTKGFCASTIDDPCEAARATQRAFSQKPYVTTEFFVEDAGKKIISRLRFKTAGECDAVVGADIGCRNTSMARIETLPRKGMNTPKTNVLLTAIRTINPLNSYV